MILLRPTMKKLKRKRPKTKEFIARIDPQVDKALDEALAMVESGKLNMAEPIIVKLLREHPDLHSTHFAMGVLCGMKGRYDEAIVYFDNAIRIFPYFVEAWFNKGAAHQKKLEVGEMIRAYQKVVELGDPAEDFVRQARAIIKRSEQQIQEDVGVSLDIHLKGMDKFNRAFAAMERSEWEDALRGFQEVLAIIPRHPQSYGNMGICYGHLGRKKEAIDAFDKALELDPKYEPARLNRRVFGELKEGDKPPAIFKSVDYYKDYATKKQSLWERLFG
jgi:tetratricopeptide (TPR) repeat protein